MRTAAGTIERPMRVIVTGATGMVGEGVVHECLLHPDVERVLIVGRRASGMSHPKLEEAVLADFFDWSPIADKLAAYDGCFFCLGVSSVGMKEADYTRVTYDLTLRAAEALSQANPGMVFCYITGSGTDSSERGRVMWARVKGATENALLRLPFRRAYMFRPGYIHPTRGLRNTHRFYFALSWLYPPIKRLFPRAIISLQELGIAMIHAVRIGFDRSVLSNADIVDLAHAAPADGLPPLSRRR